jgi:predicted RNA-binding protein YlxR (DUF448 family)/ribosomal protein L30E
MTAAVKKMGEDEAMHRESTDVGGSRERLDDASSRSRERRCIVSGEVMPDSRLVRFVADPDGHVVPDVAAKLPGRGLWVTATRKAVMQAVEKKLFARAAKANVTATADLAERTEKALVARMLGDLGIARRSGALVLGFDNVLRALDSRRPASVLIEAIDGSKDGKRKLYNAAHARGMKPQVLECLTSAELGLALGRENVIHAAVQPGGLAERLTFDAERLQGFRPAGNERDS